MTLSGLEDLAIAELAFYVPAGLAAAAVAFRHGFGRQDGWVFILVLSVVRLVGAALTIAADSNTQASDYVSLLTAASVLSSLGITFLIKTLEAILKRLNQDMGEGYGISPRILRLTWIPLLIAIILSIVGGTRQTSSDPSTVQSGEDFYKAAVVLFLLVFLFIVGVWIFTASKYSHIPQGERGLLLVVGLSLPLVFVRIVYSLCVAFSPGSKTFSLYSPNVWTEAFMSLLEEFLVVLLILIGGLTCAPLRRPAAKSSLPEYDLPSQPQYHQSRVHRDGPPREAV